MSSRPQRKGPKKRRVAGGERRPRRHLPLKFYERIDTLGRWMQVLVLIPVVAAAIFAPDWLRIALFVGVGVCAFGMVLMWIAMPRAYRILQPLDVLGLSMIFGSVGSGLAVHLWLSHWWASVLVGVVMITLGAWAMSAAEKRMR